MPRNELTWFGGAFMPLTIPLVTYRLQYSALQSVIYLLLFQHHPPILWPGGGAALVYWKNTASVRARNRLSVTVQLQRCRKKKHLPGSPVESHPKSRQIGSAAEWPTAAVVQSAGGIILTSSAARGSSSVSDIYL